MIIERMLRCGMGFEISGMRIPVLFYADDGLIMARSTEEASGMAGALEKCAREYGLTINRGKSACMICNEQGDDGMVNEVNGIGVVEEMIEIFGGKGGKCEGLFQGEQEGESWSGR